MNDKKYWIPYDIKYNLYKKIEIDINHALDEQFNAFAEKLGCKRFVTKKYIEQATKSVGGIFETNLQKSVAEWFNFISDELTRKQITDENSLHAETIADILNFEKNRYIDDLGGLMHEVTMESIRPPIFLDCLSPDYICYGFVHTCMWSINRQYRINTFKEIFDESKSHWLTVIQRRMGIMFKKIEDVWSDET